IDKAEARAASEHRLAGISSGFPAWDARSQGMSGGELLVGAGTPGTGKSTFSRMVARHVADQHGPVMVASCEMGKLEIASCLLATESGVPLHAIRSGPRGADDWPRLRQAEDCLRDLPIHLRPDTRTVGQIAAAARQYVDRGGLSLLVVDYLQRLKAVGRRRDSRAIEIGDWTGALKELAVDLDIPILCLSQLSRSHVKERRRPGMADLRESGSIEQDADGVFFLFRDPMPTPGEAVPQVLDDLVMFVEKHRNGPAGYEVPLRFNRPILHIEDRTLAEF
ncbi:MAG: DnaB-like helicase C-terminal domain-containing protein, partial [Acidobacteriota bacterium]